jgi:hypothetical protein
VSYGAAAALCHGGSSPVRQGGDGRAWVLLWGEGVSFPGSIGAGGGRPGVLHGEVSLATSMAMADDDVRPGQGRARPLALQQGAEGEGVEARHEVCGVA